MADSKPRLDTRKVGNGFRMAQVNSHYNMQYNGPFEDPIDRSSAEFHAEREVGHELQR